MDIVEFSEYSDRAALLDYAAGVDWGAARMLRSALAEGTFAEKFGDSARAYFMLDGAAPIGFGALVEQDYAPMPQHRPWIAMIWVDPDYRGRRLSETMVRFLEDRAREGGWETAHILTQHKGLYEKYGYEFIREVDTPVHDHDYFYAKDL